MSSLHSWCFYSVLLSCNDLVRTAIPESFLPIAALCEASWICSELAIGEHLFLCGDLRLWKQGNGHVKSLRKSGAAVSLQVLLPFPRTGLWSCTPSGEDSSCGRCGPLPTAAFPPTSLSCRWAWRVTWWCRPRWRSACTERCGHIRGKRTPSTTNPALSRLNWINFPSSPSPSPQLAEQTLHSRLLGERLPAVVLHLQRAGDGSPPGVWLHHPGHQAG